MLDAAEIIRPLAPFGLPPVQISNTLLVRDLLQVSLHPLVDRRISIYPALARSASIPPKKTIGIGVFNSKNLNKLGQKRNTLLHESRPSPISPPSHLASFRGPDTRPQTSCLLGAKRYQQIQAGDQDLPPPSGRKHCRASSGVFWSTSNIDLNCPCLFFSGSCFFSFFSGFFFPGHSFSSCHQLRVCSVFLFLLLFSFFYHSFLLHGSGTCRLYFFFYHNALIPFFFSLSFFFLTKKNFIRLIRLFGCIHLLLDRSNKGRNGKRKRTISGDFSSLENKATFTRSKTNCYNPQQWASLSRTTGLGSSCSQPPPVRIRLHLHSPP